MRSKYVTLSHISQNSFLEAQAVPALSGLERGLARMFLGKESELPQSTDDRRNMRRFDMRLPASVKVAGSDSDELLTETQNVSARGVFFYLDRALLEGSRIEVTLTFPPHVTLTDSVRVRFTARVVRVEDPLPASRIGVAALIEEYEFLRSNPAPDFFPSLNKDWPGSN